MTDFFTDGRTLVMPDGGSVACSMGRMGLVAASDKVEGDGKTPMGSWGLTQVLYRPDKIARPKTALPVAAVSRWDGWCDDPADRAYNCAVRLPYPASCEALWRKDGLYDLVILTDHNQHPAVPGLGSAIFLHCRAVDDGPTAGCISVARDFLEPMMRALRPCSRLIILQSL